MRLTAGSIIAVAAIALAALLVGCGRRTADGKAAAASSRAHVAPAARELYQTLYNASPHSVVVLDGTYVSCGTGTTTLSYDITLRLFPFVVGPDTDFDPFRDRVVSLVRRAGWTLRPQPVNRSVTLPYVPSAYYQLRKREQNVTLSGKLGMFGDQHPAVGVGGTLSVNGPCFDAHGAAGSLRSHPVSSPLASPAATPPTSHS